MNKCFSLLMLLFISLHALAQNMDPQISASLTKLGLKVEQILPAPVDNLRTVLTSEGVFYVSSDGKYLLQGPLLDISHSSTKNITNQLLMQRLEQLSQQMIIYPAAEPHYTVTVFTDITCGYCHKLHQMMSQYNKLGITVRYLAFPRQGSDSNVGQEMQSIWCNTDPKQALDNAMNKGKIMAAKCGINLAKQFQLGILFGVRATPAIILSDGTLLLGYQSPESLLAILKQHFSSGQSVKTVSTQP